MELSPIDSRGRDVEVVADLIRADNSPYSGLSNINAPQGTTDSVTGITGSQAERVARRDGADAVDALPSSGVGGGLA